MTTHCMVCAKKYYRFENVLFMMRRDDRRLTNEDSKDFYTFVENGTLLNRIAGVNEAGNAYKTFIGESGKRYRVFADCSSQVEG